MTGLIAETSPRRAARIAGFANLIVFVLAIFANFFVVEGLIEPGDAAATAANIMDSEGLFRSGLVAFTVVFVLDLVITWALYVFFKTVNRDLSMLAALFRLVYTVLLGVALIGFFLVLQLVSGAGYLSVFESGQLDAQVMLSLDVFNYGWLIGLVCFGVHLILLGYLILKSGFIPRVLGILLILAGAGYVIDTFANALLANYDDYATVFLLIVAVPSVVGELAFTIWLLWRGGKAHQTLA
jgi:hypothetical protein